MKSMEPNSTYSTKDLTLAATLLSLKFALTGVDYQWEGSKNMPICYFKFDNVQALSDTIKEYFGNSLLIEPKLFMTNVRALKSEIDNYRNSPDSPANRK